MKIPKRPSHNFTKCTAASAVIAVALTSFASQPNTAIAAQPIVTNSIAQAGLPQSQITPIKGTLREGLDALTSKNTEKALGIRAAMRPGSIERKTLAWAIAISPSANNRAGDIAAIAGDLPNWPGQNSMTSNFERAFLRGKPSHKQVISVLGGRMPKSDEGIKALALAYIESGQKERAAKIIHPIYHKKRMTTAQQASFVKEFSKVLSRANHKHRMDQLLYNDRVKAALALAPLAKAESLAKGRSSVIRREKNAGSALNAVHKSWHKDPSFTFSRIQHLRRTDQYREAASLLLGAPTDQNLLIDPDEWWVERRLISRALLERGDAKTAYRLVANHSAQSARAKVDAEFHAGWYALRFLGDESSAFTHFSNILQHSTQPLSVSRAYYWLGRTQEAAGKSSAAKQFYAQAAQLGGTYYGQLALAKLGQSKITIKRQKASNSDKQNFQSRELVQAINLLEQNGYAWRADIIYRHLARNLQSAGELALLAHRAEKRGNHNLSLQVGKIAYTRAFAADNLAFPTGAIPRDARVSSAGLALSYAIARQESAFKTDAVSGAGARGLLQLLPSTAKAVAKRHGLSYSKAALTKNPALNASLGAAYLEEQKAKFNGSYILTFAAYNAGPRRAEEWVARFGSPAGLPIDKVVDWVEMIPFTETRNYVMRVMENYQVYKTRISDAPLQIEQDLRKG